MSSTSLFSVKCPFHTFAAGFIAASGLFLLSQHLHKRRVSRRESFLVKTINGINGTKQPAVPKIDRVPPELSKCSYAAELETAIEIALEAGEKTKNALNELKDVYNKGSTGIDFVTDVDRANEVLIFTALKKAFPHHSFIGEESSGDAGGIPKLTDAPTWIVDPIDGTTNFVHSFPYTCVSIALAIDQKPVVGVVYDPSADELFVAVYGLGAYLNSKQITVSRAESINTSLILTETGYQRDSKKLDTIYACLRSVVNCGPHSVRIMGSCVLDLCFVACGRLDAMYLGVAGEGGKIWDYAAGSLVVLEAGGFVGDVFGKIESDRILHSESILACATAELQKEMINALVRGANTSRILPAIAPSTVSAGSMSPLGKTISDFLGMSEV